MARRHKSFQRICLTADPAIATEIATVLGGLFPKSVYAAMIDRIDLSLCDVPGRLPLMKPQMRVATLTGGHAGASAAAAIPIARLFLDSSWARRNGQPI